jgi:hypothetical protein
MCYNALKQETHWWVDFVSVFLKTVNRALGARERGLAAWCLGSWWCMLWIRTKCIAPVEYALVYPLQLQRIISSNDIRAEGGKALLKASNATR